MKKHIKLYAIIITIIISGTISLASIHYMGDYAWTVFILTPILLGFLPPYIHSKYSPITKKDAYALAFFTSCLALVCLLAFALEGMICIAMVSPLVFILSRLGAYMAIKTFSVHPLSTKTDIFILCILSSISFSFDTLNKSTNLIKVNSEIIIQAPIEEVWHHVVSFSTIPSPTDWIFKTGIAYPIDAKIKGQGVGAIRYCNFTTGSFVEPITTWDEPNLLAFSVEEEPVAMEEYNPFWDIHPPHLDGYFSSKKGQFKLERSSENSTRVIGTTWYTLDIMPNAYWKLWSDFIIHRIHKRVLNHIKLEAESNSNF